MSFHFKLEPLLRLRRSVEHQRAIALQKASLQLVGAEEALSQLDRFLVDAALADASALSAGRTGADLQFANSVDEQLCRLRLRLNHEIHECVLLRNQAATAYQNAYRQREILETLAATQRRELEVEQQRRRQQELDATFLLQSWPHRVG